MNKKQRKIVQLQAQFVLKLAKMIRPHNKANGYTSEDIKQLRAQHGVNYRTMELKTLLPSLTDGNLAKLYRVLNRHPYYFNKSFQRRSSGNAFVFKREAVTLFIGKLNTNVLPYQKEFLYPLSMLDVVKMPTSSTVHQVDSK